MLFFLFSFFGKKVAGSKRLNKKTLAIINIISLSQISLQEEITATAGNSQQTRTSISPPPQHGPHLLI